MTNVASEVTARLSSTESSAFSRQHLANLIWSFATLEVLETLPYSYSNHFCRKQLRCCKHCNPQVAASEVAAKEVH